ncbi:MAG: hypothetical protein R3B07_16510 [Polyangiaceae bacterium]
MDSIAKAVDTEYRPKGMGHMVKFNLQDADLAELVNHISGMTGKRFIYGSKVRQIKATVVSPTPVTLAEAYEAFLSILEANGMTVVPHGRFLKIVDTGNISSQATPIYSRGAPVCWHGWPTSRGSTACSTSRRMTWRSCSRSSRARREHLDLFPRAIADHHRHWLQRAAHDPHHQWTLVAQAPRCGSSRFTTVPLLIWRSRSTTSSSSPGRRRCRKWSRGRPLKVVADEQTNALVIVGTEDSYLRLLEFMKRLDTAPAARGAKIHVCCSMLSQTSSRRHSLRCSGTAAADGARGFWSTRCSRRRREHW